MVFIIFCLFWLIFVGIAYFLRGSSGQYINSDEFVYDIVVTWLITMAIVLFHRIKKNPPTIDNSVGLAEKTTKKGMDFDLSKLVKPNIGVEAEYSGPANRFVGLVASGGWLFLMKNKMYFHPHIANINRDDWSMPYSNITDVVKAPMIKQITVLYNGGKQTFVVNGRDRWIQEIKSRIG